MVCRLELGSLKSIELIPRRIRPERGHCRGACSTRRWQQQRDQIWRTLEQAIEPVIRFQAPPPGIARLATKLIVRQYHERVSVFLRGLKRLRRAPPSTSAGPTLSTRKRKPLLHQLSGMV
jgi:hypothetical protein